MSLKIVARVYCNVEPCDASAEIEVAYTSLFALMKNGVYGEAALPLPDGWSQLGGSTCVCPAHAYNQLVEPDR